MSQSIIVTVRPTSEAPDVEARLLAEGFEIGVAPYAFFRAQRPGCTITFYEKGKVVVQGPGAKDFNYLVTGDDAPDVFGGDDDDDPAETGDLGLEAALQRHPKPPPEQWIGLDETGKGDYFGPLVVVAAAVERKHVPLLVELGVADSKKLTDKKIAIIAKEIQHICPNERLVIGPEKYNELYARIGNLNALLGWAHAKALESALEKAPNATWALSDQFSANPSVIRRHFGPLAKAITWSQWPKAESDPAVAVASIHARAEFVRRLDWLRNVAGRVLPKGAGAPVLAAGRELVAKHGPELLRKIAKLHFKTTQDVAPGFRG